MGLAEYKQTWAYEDSVRFVPTALRALSEDWVAEMISTTPIRSAEVVSVSANALTKFPGLFLRND